MIQQLDIEFSLHPPFYTEMIRDEINIYKGMIIDIIIRENKGG